MSSRVAHGTGLLSSNAAAALWCRSKFTGQRGRFYGSDNLWSARQGKLVGRAALPRGRRGGFQCCLLQAA